MNPEPFLQLDRVIHEKGRLAIMSMLAASPELAFTELRDTLNMTDGNLTSHMRTLQEAGIIKYARGKIHIVDVVALQDSACECYESVKQHYNRLLGNR